MYGITPILHPWILTQNTELYDIGNQGQGQFRLMTNENYLQKISK